MSIFQLGQKLNEKHSTRSKTKNVVNPEYPEHMIGEIMISVRQSGIVQHVNGDLDQLRLIGRDLVDNVKHELEHLN